MHLIYLFNLKDTYDEFLVGIDFNAEMISYNCY